MPPDATPEPAPPAPKPKRRHRFWRYLGLTLLLLAALLTAARLAAGPMLRSYVNRTLDRNPNYDGTIGDVRIHLYRGAYSIENVRILKTTGSAAVPIFEAERVDFSVQWNALLHRKIVTRIDAFKPVLNFIDDKGDDAQDDAPKSMPSVAGGGWLDIIRDLSPFRINAATVHDGQVHLRAFHTEPPVDVYLANVNGSLSNLTNIDDATTPLAAEVSLTALAMDTGELRYDMKFDPFSYYPTFQLALRLTGLDVTETNALAKAYGNFDFEHGSFDLVTELDCREGELTGYVKPLFRNLTVLSLSKDIREDDPWEFFVEAVVGTTTGILKNHPRDQFATQIPLTGNLNSPDIDLFSALINVLRNAFVRAFLPRLEGLTDSANLQFAPGEILKPPTATSSPPAAK